jgi:surfeit locus 1 family protein
MSRKRLIAMLVFGVCGVAVLLALGQWQLRRLAWKEAIIAQIESRLDAAPAALPGAPDEARDEYRRVSVTGAFAEGELHVLTSMKPHGPGFRIIAPFVTEDGRRILIDRGFVPETEKTAPRAPGAATVTGALLWPDETDGFTPEPDIANNFWFARDAVRMAAALSAEPFIVVAETGEGEWPAPLPVTVNIPNDHLQYAITWFSLALIWIVMTALLLMREMRRGTQARPE